MLILGISAFYHDSAAVLLNGDEILAAVQEERFTRQKHDSGFPTRAVEYCLTEARISLNDLDAVVFYDKPFLKFERLLETYYAFAPKGMISFLAAIPVWIKEKIMLKQLIIEKLSQLDNIHKNKLKLLFPEHHLSHAASAYFPSPFEESAILTMDGVGEWATASICHGKGNQITILRELHFPHSLGLLYSAFTHYLGFRVNSGEYKLMGLAPYGNPYSEQVGRFEKIIEKEMVHIQDDGSIWLNQNLFDYATGMRMVKDDRWQELFGFPARDPEGDFSVEQCNLAFAIQSVTEKIVLGMAKEAARLTGSKRLCLAGGVALNCVANGRILKSGIFDDIWIQSAGGDAGGAMGAAYAAYHIHFKKSRHVTNKQDKMQGAFLGPAFSEYEIKKTAEQYGASYTHYEAVHKLCDDVATLLDQGFAVGWFQGRMEWGPRALGNRSILADARNPEMQKKLNLKVKHREGFRPFAPSVLAEDTPTYFEMDGSSPYMLFVADLKPNHRNRLSENYHSLPWKDKLYYIRSDVPAITHIDYSARLQTVHRDTNPRFWQLIKSFRNKTGCGMIVNTSFNVRGEPIVCTPEDAYKCFMRTEMDYLVMGNYLFNKKELTSRVERTDWRQEIDLD